MMRLLSGVALVAYALSACAQCVVSEVAPLSPAKASCVEAKAKSALEAALSAALEAKDYTAIGAVLSAAVKSKDYVALSRMSKAMIGKFDALEGLGDPMSIIDALCNKGRWLEKSGADTSKVMAEIEKVIERIQLRSNGGAPNGMNKAKKK